MDDIQKNKVQEWLDKKWGHKACPVCGTDHWQVANNFARLMQYNPDEGITLSSLGAPAYPLLPIFCTNCGYSLLINAVSAGILESQPDTETKSSKKTSSP